MSRSQRIHIPGGTYYVVQRSGVDQRMFARPADYELFEKLLTLRLRIASSRVLLDAKLCAFGLADLRGPAWPHHADDHKCLCASSAEPNGTVRALLS